MIFRIIFACFILIAVSCSKDTTTEPAAGEESKYISAVDISSYPKIRMANTVFYDSEGVTADFISLIKSKGVNTVRLKLWVDPTDGHSGFNEVRQFSQELKARGLKIWLTVHYSDTWADPGRQQLPQRWQNITRAALKDSVYDYTKKVATQIAPHYIQIGNEVNSGFLHPHGNINNVNNFKELLKEGIAAVRENAAATKIMIHFAGIENASWFFGNLTDVDYDIIGLSYYPIWHGKSLSALKSLMDDLSSIHNKEIVIAETAYPFTLGWNDWTNNIVGLENQLILPDFPATAVGQRDYIRSIAALTQEVAHGKGIGFCYWGAELVAWQGNQSTNGSPWENQSIFDFQNRALPVLNEFTVE